MYFFNPLYVDPLYWVAVVVGVVLAGWAQNRVRSAFAKYSRISISSGITGFLAARKVLDANGLRDVSIEMIPGRLSDHYDPEKRVLRLSREVYNSDSIAAVGVAAHEAGHAIQHSEGYAPLKIRGGIVPLASFGMSMAPMVFIFGLFLGHSPMGLVLIKAALVLMGATLLFKLVTLPVEYNASARAMEQLQQQHIVSKDEIEGADEVLSAAALTYLAAAIATLLMFLVYISYLNRRRR